MRAKLGELLIERGVISRDDLERALAVQRSVGGRLGVHLVRLGIVGEEQLATFLTQQLAVPLVGREALAAIPEDVIARLPRHLAEQHRAVPFAWDGRDLFVCLADPQNLDRLDELAFVIGCRVRPHLVTEMVLDEALEKYYGIAADTWDVATTASPSLGAPWRPPTVGRTEPEPEAPPMAPASEPELLPEDAAESFAPNMAATTYAPSMPMPAEAVPQPAPAPAAAAPGVDPFQQLSEAQTRDDVARAVFAFFARLFSQVCVARVEAETAMAVLAGTAGAVREVEPGVGTTFAEAPTLREVMSRPQLAHREQISDPGLRRLCEALGMAPGFMSILPVFDYGKPAYVVLGQGRTTQQLRNVANVVKLFLTAVSQSLRMVKLRDDIRAERNR